MTDFFLPPLTGWASKGHRLPTSSLAPAAARGKDYSTLARASLTASILGTGMQAIGAYYGMKSQKEELKQQALSAEFQASMSAIAARSAAADANAILEAGKQEVGMSALAYSKQASKTKTSFAARGIQLGAGSSAEALASLRYAKQVDALTIRANAVRQANAARMQAQNYRTQGQLARVSAQNLRSTAGSLSPALGAITTLIGGAGRIGQQWAADRRFGPR